MLKDKNILLIITGGIAAYKSLELIRLIRKNNGTVRCILTKGGAQFVTPLSVSALSENPVYSDLWSLKDETEMGHIRLSRESDLIVVAPASADILAKMAHGLADDLASTTLLAANKKILVAPAMNPHMWDNPATQNNINTLKQRNISFCEPEYGDMACGESGQGRMCEAQTIFNKITGFFFEKPLKGKKAIVTSGPTHEPLDPVRFLGNRSSGKQGHAIAQALHHAGAEVTLVSGPVTLSPPSGINIIRVETGKEMLDACLNALPADICICAAAVSDWTPQSLAAQKIKKTDKNTVPDIKLIQNPDILHTISTLKNKRPPLVIGFAAETHDTETNAKEKLLRKECDWILANSVGKDETGVEKTFSSDENQIYFVSHDTSKWWGRMSKHDVAEKIVKHIIDNQ